MRARGQKLKLSRNNIIILVLLAVSAVVLIVFSLPDLVFTDDETANKLIIETVPRAVVGIVMLFVLALLGYKSILKPITKKLPRALLWSVPCFLVALANFPYSALISGSAVVESSNLIWLFLLKCLAIGLMEEVFFRGLVQTVILERLENHRYRIPLAVIISSAVFGLWHLLNLFYGANVGATMLQVGYSFLIGAMLSVVLIKTENIWLCVLIHALFDVGGSLIPDLGSGRFQDTTFWILTAAAAVICTAHILITLYKTKTCYAYAETAKKTEKV